MIQHEVNFCYIPYACIVFFLLYHTDGLTALIVVFFCVNPILCCVLLICCVIATNCAVRQHAYAIEQLSRQSSAPSVRSPPQRETTAVVPEPAVLPTTERADLVTMSAEPPQTTDEMPPPEYDELYNRDPKYNM